MTTPTDEHPDLVTVVASMRAAEGQVGELRAALQALVEATVAEEGCVNYDLHESIDEPGLFVFYENWASAEHLAAHGTSPHIRAFGERAGELLAEGGADVMRVRRLA